VSRHDADKNATHLPEPLPRTTLPSGRPTPLALWRGAALANAAATSGADTGALLKALARRWPLALALGLLLAGAGAIAAWFLLAAPYTAFAQVQVKASPEWIGFRGPEEGRSEFLTFLRTQARHLKSRFVLSAALTREETKNLPIVLRQADPLAWLEDELLVESQEGSEIITATLRGPEPTELTALINAVIKAYEKEVVQAENDQRKKRLDEVENQYNLRYEDLRKKKESLKQMADDLGATETLALSQKQVNLLAWLGELRRQHGLVRGELMQAQLRLETYKAQPPKSPELPDIENTVNEALDADPAVKVLKDKQERYQEVVDQYERRRPGVEDSVKKEAQREVEKLDQKLADKRAKVRANVEERLRTQAKAIFDKAKAEYDAIGPSLEKQMARLTKEEEQLRKEIETLGKEADKFGRSS
jgi:polysaccharide biosynthesis transport protein